MGGEGGTDEVQKNPAIQNFSLQKLLTLEGGWGWVIEKKISCKRLSEEKIACSANVIESLWREKRKKISCPTRLLEKNS